MLDRTLHTEIEIATPPQRVWEVLTEFERWPEWNPVIVALTLEGPLRVGAPVRLSIDLGPRLGRRPIAARLVTVDDGRELAWEGGPRGVMSGCHGFRLEPTAQGTRVVHAETFSGLAAPLFVRLLGGGLHKGYRRLNERLRERCEAK